MARFLFPVLFLLFLPATVLQAQSYEVSCSHQPLNELLVELRGRYDLHFSFDDRSLSEFSISLESNFSSKKDLMNALLRGLPLSWEQMGEVLVIFPSKRNDSPPEYLITGRILERGSGEPLPFSHVLINDYATVTDLKGVFSYRSAGDSTFQIRASHLGCYIVDTVLQTGISHRIFLTPISYDLPEVVVRDNIVERSVQMGEDPGLIKLNSYIARYLPGNGDNSVFNLLRLQPGILAAGEQPNDLIIWGSYEGTSRVQFDGFTIWGLKNFNDNISAVNPFLAKSVNVLKGGYDASNNDVSGGLVNIAGKLGSTREAGINLFINNQTVNGMLELPLSSKSSFIAAFRKTYYNLFEEDDLLKKDAKDYEFKVNVTPDYAFRDFNLKYSLQGENGDLFFVSMLGAKDRFAYEVSQERRSVILQQETVEDNRQFGSTLYYGKSWNNGALSEFTMSWSGLTSDYGLKRSLEAIRSNRSYSQRDDLSQNDVSELSLKADNHFRMSKFHNFDFGGGLVHNEVFLREDTFDVVVSEMREKSLRANLFLQDEISLGPWMRIKPGFRFNHLFQAQKTFLSPRVALNIDRNEKVKINAAWGHYHQFLVKSSVMDESGNYRYTWTIADDGSVPVMKSVHSTLGAAYTLNTFTASIDAYYKTMDGITRYIRYRGNREDIFEGEGRSYGLDFFVKKDLRRHSLWVSYSLSKTEELFTYFPDKEYRRAPHDQRHEIKVTGLVDLHPFHFSGAWVYGSGFPLYANYLSRKYTEPDYSRLDLSLVYQFGNDSFSGEAGLSLLNALNSENVKYSSFERIPLVQLNTAYIDAEAVDFTPLVFLKVGF